MRREAAINPPEQERQPPRIDRRRRYDRWFAFIAGLIGIAVIAIAVLR